MCGRIWIGQYILSLPTVHAAVYDMSLYKWDWCVWKDVDTEYAAVYKL